jgi:hypothetical protein
VPFFAVAVNVVAVVDTCDSVAVNFNAVDPLLPSANFAVAVDRLNEGNVAMLFLRLKKWYLDYMPLNLSFPIPC